MTAGRTPCRIEYILHHFVIYDIPENTTSNALGNYIYIYIFCLFLLRELDRERERVEERAELRDRGEIDEMSIG